MLVQDNPMHTRAPPAQRERRSTFQVHSASAVLLTSHHRPATHTLSPVLLCSCEESPVYARKTSGVVPRRCTRTTSAFQSEFPRVRKMRERLQLREAESLARHPGSEGNLSA